MLLVHGLESRESFYFVFFIIQFAQHNSYVSICIQIETYEFIGFCTNSYKIIQFLYELYSTNSYKVSFFVFSKSVQTNRERASCEGEARAASA